MTSNFKNSEKKWQKQWEKEEIYHTKDRVKGRKNHMVLVEFPYPSGNLHIGHWYAFAIPDIYARKLRMDGKNVSYPIGFDAFGLPAENAAIKRSINPKNWTQKNIAFMTKQLQSMGAMFDWQRTVSTIDPQYYKWTQWIFLQMYKKGIAYRAKTLVNWCPKDKTVLANEQVIDGKCERCLTEVIQKEFEQWMFKITDYADRLIDDIEGLDWPNTTVMAQKNWIGRSEGTIVKFKVQSPNLKVNQNIEVFTTRVDTIFGCTYVVLAPENNLVEKLKNEIENFSEVTKYVSESKKKLERERLIEEKQKTGVELKGVFAINPFTQEKVKVFVADYVLGSYGTGAVMAVPAHDERDFEFAKKYNLSIKKVIEPIGNNDAKCFTEDGVLINSRQYNGMKSEEARKQMSLWLEKNALGKKKKNYRLRDWVLSRQRYWGVPIPMVHCPKCGYVPVKEKDLPVVLPPLKDFLPSDDGRSPLAKAKKWVSVKCPVCKGDAQRETDTMDTFVDSSWYFIRYADPKNKKYFADKQKMKAWLPVPMYVGGAEHNTMHLLYSRFFTKVLHDLKLVHFNEPFIGRRNHGVILGPDNQKMSKSKGNVIDPDDMVKKFGADVVRMYMAFTGPYEQGGPWQPSGVSGIERFLSRIWAFSSRLSKSRKSDIKVIKLLHRTIAKVGSDVLEMKFNTAISALMILFNEMEKSELASKDDFENFLKILAPFAPHLTEEIWRNVLKNKKSIHLESWPKYNKKLTVEDDFELVVQVSGKIRDKIIVPKGISQEKAKEVAFKSDKVKQAVGNGEIRKVIFVPDKLINLVI